MELLLSQIRDNRPLIISGLLIILHVVGVMGMASPWAEQFVSLTPFHLMATFVLLMIPETDNSRSLWIYATVVIVVTFIIELIGVQTGIIFGSYAYGDVLGPKLFGTPVLIGVNWFIIAYAIGIVLSRVDFHPVLLSAVGAAIMTGLDVLIEPVAIMLGFWEWSGPVPLQNYAAWFVIAFLLLLAFNYSKFRKGNAQAPLTLWLQFGFFVALNAIRIIHG